MLEKLLMETLKLETRKDPNNGQERKINLDLKCDLAYIRCQFKRYLNKNKDKINYIKAYYTWNNAYTITKDSFVNGWDALEDKEKIINSLRNAIKDSTKEGQPVFAIKFN